jgi:uncharacterized membrane protein YebE (DUF533 family)
MKNKSLIILATLVGVAGLGYLGYYLYKKGQTSSQDPEKNERQIIQNLID